MAMASLVARAAIAASLPSGSARRLGSGRLPPAALHGHGAVVLAGRKGVTGHGGVLAVKLKAPAKVVKVACSDPDPMGDAEEAVQDKLKDIAERCITLLHDAMRPLPRAKMTQLYSIFWQLHMAFATVRSSAAQGSATLEMAVLIADKLDVLRKMVSSAYNTPLPLDMKEGKRLIIPSSGAVFPSDDAEVLMFAMIEKLYKTVKEDIEYMQSAAATD